MPLDASRSTNSLLFHEPDGLSAEKKSRALHHQQLSHKDAADDWNHLTQHQTRLQQDPVKQGTIAGPEESADDTMRRKSGRMRVDRNKMESRDEKRMMRQDEPFLLETLVESLKCEHDMKSNRKRRC